MSIAFVSKSVLRCFFNVVALALCFVPAHDRERRRSKWAVSSRTVKSNFSFSSVESRRNYSHAADNVEGGDCRFLWTFDNKIMSKGKGKYWRHITECFCLWLSGGKRGIFCVQSIILWRVLFRANWNYENNCGNSLCANSVLNITVILIRTW